MKKIVLLFTLFVSFKSFGQWFPQSVGSKNTEFYSKGLIGADTGFIQRHCFSDTTEANLGTIKNKAGVYIRTCDDITWMRSNSLLVWVRIAAGSGADTIYVADDLYVVWETINGSLKQVIHRLHSDGLVSGGIITSAGCMDIQVTSASYYLNNGTHYTSPATTLTIAAAHITLDRIDGVILDTSGLVSIRTGTASATPNPPSYNPASEILLSTIYVPAGATCLSIGAIVIYDETGGTEYTPTTSGTITADPNNLDNPYNLLNAYFISTYADGAKIILTKPSGQDTVFNNSVFAGQIRLNGRFYNQVQMQLFLASVPVSNNIVLNPYFGVLDSNFYQPLSVPAYAFAAGGNIIYDEIVYTLAGDDLSGAKGFYLDYLQLQTGIQNVTSGKGVLNFTKNAAGDSIILTREDGMRFAVKDSSGTGGGGGTLQQATDASIAAVDNPFINAHGNPFHIDSTAFLVQDYGGVNQTSVFANDFESGGIATTNDTADVEIFTKVAGDQTHAIMQASSTVSGIENSNQLLLNENSITFNGIEDNLPKTKLIIAHPDTLLTTPTYVYVPDADTMKVYPFPTGGGGGGGGEALDQTLLNGNTTRQKMIWDDTAAVASGSGLSTTELRPQNFGTSYAVGQSREWTTGYDYFTGVNASGRPNTVARLLTYNPTLTGSEGGFDFRAETHYEVGGAPFFEFHFPQITGLTAGGSTGNRRINSFYTNKVTGATIHSQQIDLLAIYQGVTDTCNLCLSAAGADLGLNTNGYFSLTNKRVISNAFYVLLGNSGPTITATGVSSNRMNFNTPIFVVSSATSPALQTNVGNSNSSGLAIYNTIGGSGNFRGVYSEPATTGTFDALKVLNLSAGTNQISLGGNGGKNLFQLYDYSNGFFWNMYMDNSTVQKTFKMGSSLDSAFKIRGDNGNTYIKYNLAIGTADPAASAKLDVQSTTQGFLPPRMTATQASAISSPAEGLLVYVTDTNGTFTAKGWWGYDGAAWQKLNN